MIARRIENEILERLHKGKLLLITGPRQVGKTTLMKQIMFKQGQNASWLSGSLSGLHLSSGPP